MSLPVVPPRLPPPEEPKVGFWASLWAKVKPFFTFVGRKLLAPGAVLIIVLVAVVLFMMGFKNLQIGGLLGKLLGRKDPSKKAIDVSNTVPKDRVDENGKVIPPGEPDSKGMTQVVVVPIQDPGLFSNPDTVVFTPPGETESVEVQLPDGVKAKDVEQVIVVQPDKYVVTVKDNSGVSAKTVDDLLKKYG